MKNSLFIPGLWLNPQGDLALNIKGQVEILPQVGLPSIAARVQNLADAIKQKRYHTLIAHSAGCSVVSRMLQEMDFKDLIERVIFINPSPTPGIQFTPLDPIFWVMPSYFKAMFLGKQFILSEKHAMNLLSTAERDSKSMMKNLVEDSGSFAKELTLMQFKKRFFLRKLSHNVRIDVMSGTMDRMVGSTWKKTENSLTENNKGSLLRYNVDHIWALKYFDLILKDLHVEA